MIPPIEVRQAAGRYAGNNTAIAAAFVQGWLFAHPEYKKEKRQSYKPRGLASFKKKIMEMSGGDPVVADAIVEQSMANNYQGIFPLKYKTTYARQSDIIGKVADILAD